MIILISSIPVIAVYLWFHLAKYQFKLVRFLFALLAGAATFIPALILQQFLIIPSLTLGRTALLYEFFVRIAFTEEMCRLLMISIFYLAGNLIIKRNSVKPDEPVSQQLTFNEFKKGSAIGLVAGLGFALLESVRFTVSSLDTGILFLRIFSAFPLHASCGSRVGAAAVMFRSHPKQALLRIITATAIHGVYNFMLELPFGIPSITAILIALSAFITSVLNIRGVQFGITEQKEVPNETPEE